MENIKTTLTSKEFIFFNTCIKIIDGAIEKHADARINSSDHPENFFKDIKLAISPIGDLYFVREHSEKKVYNTLESYYFNKGVGIYFKEDTSNYHETILLIRVFEEDKEILKKINQNNNKNKIDLLVTKAKEVLDTEKNREVDIEFDINCIKLTSEYITLPVIHFASKKLIEIYGFKIKKSLDTNKFYIVEKN